VLLAPRADLFRLLGDEDRLRLLALCAEEELTVGELASLLGESQPQITKKSQPLREAGLLAARRDGTRTLLRTMPTSDIIVDTALAEGVKLCTLDGSLSRVPNVISQREELSRRFFDQAPSEPLAQPELATWLPILAPLLPRTELAVDIGTGDGTLLPLLSPIYQRIVAVDRSPARLARCAAMIAERRLPNVRLHEGDVDDAALLQDIAQRGGADLVVMARVLHHAARPQDAIASATRLLHTHGHLVIVDYLPHDDESMREQGDVWLGFEPDKLRGWMSDLDIRVAQPFPSLHKPALQIIVGHRKKRTS
jgi:DNA-binding transcriptional ArsR family regulator/precorrin-6B methylase 2